MPKTVELPCWHVPIGKNGTVALRDAQPVALVHRPVTGRCKLKATPKQSQSDPQLGGRLDRLQVALTHGSKVQEAPMCAKHRRRSWLITTSGFDLMPCAISCWAVQAHPCTSRPAARRLAATCSCTVFFLCWFCY